eukprot:8110119-Alexandrium_andersonii.AAC.1
MASVSVCHASACEVRASVFCGSRAQLCRCTCLPVSVPESCACCVLVCAELALKLRTGCACTACFATAIARRPGMLCSVLYKAQTGITAA